MIGRLAGLLRASARDLRGSAVLEFGFIAPLLFALTIGVVDAGRLGLAISATKHAASAGARYASVRGNEGAMIASADQIVSFTLEESAGLNPDLTQVNVTWDPDNSPGSRVTVQVVHDFTFLLDPLVPLGPLTITRESTITIF